VLADYRQFVNAVHGKLPNARIVFIAIKPSLRRWHLVDKMRKANGLIRAVTEKDDRLAYVDIDKPMIGDDGKPRKELFKADGLHLNAEGYKLWTSLLLPHLTLEKEQSSAGIFFRKSSFPCRRVVTRDHAPLPPTPLPPTGEGRLPATFPHWGTGDRNPRSIRVCCWGPAN
jgi:hypothetical protein